MRLFATHPLHRLHGPPCENVVTRARRLHRDYDFCKGARKNVNMPYCPDCGTEVSTDAAFCEDCGADLNTQSADQPTPDTEPANEPPESESDGGGINWRNAIAATVLALVPAFGAYMAVGIAASDVLVWVFFVAIPVFGYLLYQRPTIKTMFGGMCFWLAVEVFLAPFILLIFTIGFASQEVGTAAGQAGAAIGGFLLVVVAFIVGLPVGIVLYLISRRLDTSEQAASGSTQAG